MVEMVSLFPNIYEMFKILLVSQCIESWGVTISVQLSSNVGSQQNIIIIILV